MQIIQCDWYTTLTKNDKVISVVSDSLWPHELYSPWNFTGQNTAVGSLSLLQGSFPTQESNWGLLHCRQILYQLSYEGSPIITIDPEKSLDKTQYSIMIKNSQEIGYRKNMPQYNKSHIWQLISNLLVKS